MSSGAIEEAKSPQQRRHASLSYNGVRGAWVCPFHEHASTLASQPADHFKSVKGDSAHCRWCSAPVPLAADEWERVEQLILHYNACPGRALHGVAQETVLLAGASLPRLAPIAVAPIIAAPIIAAPIIAAPIAAPPAFVSNAFKCMVEVFEELLGSANVLVDTLRATLRVQDLREDDAQRVRCIEDELKKPKKEVAHEIAANLLRPNLELFAAKWQISALLGSVLPRRDWNACFLDKLESRLAAFQLPPSCKLVKITGTTAPELLESKSKAVAALDNIQRILSASNKDYKLADAAAPKKRTVDDAAADVSAKKTASAAMCSRGHLTTLAGAAFCVQCGEKL